MMNESCGEGREDENEIKAKERDIRGRMRGMHKHETQHA